MSVFLAQVVLPLCRKDFRSLLALPCAGMDSLEALRQQRQECKRRSSELTHQQQQCKRKKGDLAEELSRLSISRLQRVRLLVFMWQASCSASAAATMLEHSRAHFEWFDWELEQRENFVDEVFLDTPVEDLVDLLDEEAHDIQTARREAQRLHAEYQTMQWTQALNSECAVAPEWSDVRARHLAHEAQNDIVQERYRKQPRSWCQRWRERWGGHVRKLKTGEHDSPAIMAEKARREPEHRPGNPFGNRSRNLWDIHPSMVPGTVQNNIFWGRENEPPCASGARYP